MKTIIAAVDFSDATPAVVANAVSLAKSFGANLQLFHAIEPQPGYTTYGFTMADSPAMVEFQERTTRRATGLLADLLASARAEIPNATSHLASGPPLHELLAHVRQSGADFVVVGAHGHGALASLLLGSVAEGMVRKARVPTLVVPPAQASPATPASQAIPDKSTQDENATLHQVVR